MKKWIPVKDSILGANKKGLRIKVDSVEVDEENNLLSMRIEYSAYRERGGAVLEISQRNKIQLPEE